MGLPDRRVIDKAHARRFVLAHLGLFPPRELRGKEGVLDFVRRVGCIQYDPIDVVGTNPHLVLQSRVRGYAPSMLEALLYEERSLIDGFDKQMSIYPIEDWPSFAYHRQERAKRSMEHERTAAAAARVEAVRQEIETRGPLSSLDLEDDTRMDWWLAGSARAVRIALDLLFYRGDTVVVRRTGTRRTFDLSARVLPARLRRVPSAHASHDDYLDWHVLRRAGGVGLVDPTIGAEFGGLVGWQGGRIRAAILRLVAKGLLVPLRIEGTKPRDFYVRRVDLPALEAAARASRRKPRASFIAPLDNLMWDRSLIETLFDFSYTWEVYVPAAKRRYGYYVLPVLYGDRLVARVDPAFDRASKILTVKGWWWEDGIDTEDEALLLALQECWVAFAQSLGARSIRFAKGARASPGLLRAVRDASRSASP